MLNFKNLKVCNFQLFCFPYTSENKFSSLKKGLPKGDPVKLRAENQKSESLQLSTFLFSLHF